MCGLSDVDRIIGGSNATDGEFPWQARNVKLKLLAIRKSLLTNCPQVGVAGTRDNMVVVRCGGSIIR